MIHSTKQVATLICCFIFLFSSHAHAQFTVTASTGTINTANATFAGTSGTTSIYDINIVYTGSSTTASATITLRSTGTYAIGDLTIETRTDPGYAPGTTIATLLIDGDDSGGIITGLNSLDWIAPTGGNLPARFQANIQLLDDASPFGRIGFGMPKDETIEAHAFTQILAHDCYANVTVIQDSLTTDGMADLELDGDMQGDVSCTYLRKMWMADGDLGSTSNTVQVTVLDRLENFYAQNAYANFDVAGDLNLFQIYGSTGPSGTTADGVFEGSLECDTAVWLVPGFQQVIRIWGDLHEDTTITINDELDDEAGIAIGGDLDGDIDFDQSDGLKGRVTINWLDTGGDWNGDITVGTQTLTPTSGDYPETGLGGGAVGLVAYGLHKQACNPAYVGSTWPTFSPGGTCDPLVKEELTIDLVHYGAISELVGGPDEPFEVTYASGNHCTGPNCFHSSNYVADDADWELDDTSPFPNARTMRIVGQLLPDTHYHIMVDETLECTDVPDAVSPVETKSYVYVIYRADCP